MNELETQAEIKAFLHSIGNPTMDESKLKNLLFYAVKSGKPVSDWDKTDLMTWLKSFNSISKNAIKLAVITFTRYANYSREKKDLPEKNITLSPSEINECIDFPKLIRSVITKEKYDKIVQVMKELQFDKLTPFHIRNRVIFELSWLGLNAQQIKNLKKSDISFLSGETQRNIMVVKAGATEFVAVEADLISAVKECIKTNTIDMNAMSGATRIHELIDSEYLIRPVKVGRISASQGNVAHPQQCLLDDFNKSKARFKHIGIDLSSMRIEDIRRSKIIYMFSLDHGVPNKAKHIAQMYDIKNKTEIYFLQHVSNLVYKADSNIGGKNGIYQ